jgi:hypothetical protein
MIIGLILRMNSKERYRMSSAKCDNEAEDRFLFPAIRQTDLWREREENPKKRHTFLSHE